MKARVSVQRTPVHHPKPRDDKGKPLPTNIYIDRFALCVGFLGSAILCLLGFNFEAFYIIIILYTVSFSVRFLTDW